MHRLILCALSGACAMALAAPPVSACTCVEPSAFAAVARADAVFRGRVLAITTPDPGGKVRSSSEPESVTLEVARVWKGTIPDEVTVTTARTSASCGFPFEPDGTYVVCARTEGTGLTTDLCSGTAAAGNARRLLRGLARLEAQGGADMAQEAMAIPILDAMRHGDETERADAARALSELDVDPDPLMPTLIALAEDDDPAVRATAVSAIHAAETRVTRDDPGAALVDTGFYVRALTGHDDGVRIAACRALSDPRHAATIAASSLAIDALVDAAGSPDRTLASLALGLVAGLEPPPVRAEPLLRRALRSPTSEMRRDGARGLVRMGASGIAVLQAGVLGEVENRVLAMDVIEMLGREAFRSDLAYAALVALAVTGHPASRADALGRLAEARSAVPEVRALLRASATDSSEVVRAGAIGALGHLAAAPEWKLEVLTAALADTTAIVRDRAIRTLGRMGPDALAALPALRRRLDAAEGREAAQLRAAIGRIDPGGDPDAPARR